MLVLRNILLRETYVEREKGESPNDRNDRAIRTAARYFSLELLLDDDYVDIVSIYCGMYWQ